MDTVKVQAQIRQNSEELSAFLSSLSDWESKINTRDIALKETKSDVRRNVQTRSAPAIVSSSVKREVNSRDYEALEKEKDDEASEKERDSEALEKERGNRAFAAGDFQAAIRAYTVCIGLKSANFVAFSNRAMARIRVKDFVRAEIDCDNALSINSSHVKSLYRRSIARSSLGKHRAALDDLRRAQTLDSNNKQTKLEIQKSKELMRNAVSSCPFLKIKCLMAQDMLTADLHGPDLNTK